MADSASPESKILNTLKADNNLGSFSINPALKIGQLNIRMAHLGQASSQKSPLGRTELRQALRWSGELDLQVLPRRRPGSYIG